MSSRSYCLITPCRDEAKYAKRTLEAVIRQREKPAHWVIVDDGSKDATPRSSSDTPRAFPGSACSAGPIAATASLAAA